MMATQLCTHARGPPSPSTLALAAESAPSPWTRLSRPLTRWLEPLDWGPSSSLATGTGTAVRARDQVRSVRGFVPLTMDCRSFKLDTSRVRLLGSIETCNMNMKADPHVLDALYTLCGVMYNRSSGQKLWIRCLTDRLQIDFSVGSAVYHKECP